MSSATMTTSTAAVGLSKGFILEKYFSELQKFWETEKRLKGRRRRTDINFYDMIGSHFQAIKRKKLQLSVPMPIKILLFNSIFIPFYVVETRDVFVGRSLHQWRGKRGAKNQPFQLNYTVMMTISGIERHLADRNVLHTSLVCVCVVCV